MAVESYIDPDADFLHLDNLQPIRVTGTRPKGEISVEIDKALKRPVDLKRDTAVNVEINATTQVWNFRKVDIGEGVELITGDVIVDEDGGRWEVLSAALLTYDKRYRAVCNKLRENT